MTTDAIYWLSPAAVAVEWRDGRRDEYLFPTRNEAEAYVALIPLLEGDIAAAIIRPSGIGVN